MIFRTNFIEQMRFIGNQVGIGTDSPSGKVSIRAGSSSDHANVGGVIFVSTAQVGNVGTGEDDIATYSVPANTLATNNQSLWFEASGTIANTGASKIIRVRFGGTLIQTQSFNSSTPYSWVIRGRIHRTGASSQKANVMLTWSGGSPASRVDLASTSITLSSAAILKVTGEAGADNDILCQTFTVGWADQNT
jgi:hypothetical protein